jgi:hypothetical protein
MRGTTAKLIDADRLVHLDAALVVLRDMQELLDRIDAELHRLRTCHRGGPAPGAAAHVVTGGGVLARLSQWHDQLAAVPNLPATATGAKAVAPDPLPPSA